MITVNSARGIRKIGTHYYACFLSQTAKGNDERYFYVSDSVFYACWCGCCSADVTA